MTTRIRSCGEIAPGKSLVERETDGVTDHCLIYNPKDGEPLPEGAELICVEKPDADGWQASTTLYRNGPAQVATPAYRDGYDRIFGKKQKVAEA